ncbi:hypothetical protein Tco_0825675 [Tanacetum coccineum]
MVCQLTKFMYKEIDNVIQSYHGMLPFLGAKGLTISTDTRLQELTHPGSDENRLKTYGFLVHYCQCAEMTDELKKFEEVVAAKD